MGAGVIPFAIHQSRVRFLFQTTFSGRKTGYLIDFGGGLGEGENHRQTAVREFIEETETLYFASDIKRARRSSEAVLEQMPVVDALFEKTLSQHPEWCCRRAPGDPPKPRDWKTFFIEFPYRDIESLNREWEADTSGRFKKRRQLFWVDGEQLLAIYREAPDKLWKRVRQLEEGAAVVGSIVASKAPAAG